LAPRHLVSYGQIPLKSMDQVIDVSAVDELKSRMTRRIAESEAEIARLREALDAYDRASTEAPKANAAPTARRPAGRTVSSDAVLEALASGGVSRAEICERTGGSERAVLAMLKQLEAAGQVARDGERRATRWRRATAPSAAATTPRSSRGKRARPRPKRDETPPAAATTTAATTTESGKRAAPPRPRARSRELAAGQLEELLTEAPNGLSVVALARRTGTGEGAVRERLVELERTGKVRSSGSRRTSLWRLVSDEEWVAERAAQLAKAPAGRS